VETYVCRERERESSWKLKGGGREEQEQQKPAKCDSKAILCLKSITLFPSSLRPNRRSQINRITIFFFGHATISGVAWLYNTRH
jgi:hypothetical protein